MIARSVSALPYIMVISAVNSSLKHVFIHIYHN